MAGTDGELEQLAAQINAAHEAGEHDLGSSLEHFRDTGLFLIQVGERLPHGQFIPWVRRHCPFKHSTANHYMALSRGWHLLMDSECAPNFSLAEALRRIRQKTQEDRAGKLTPPVAPRREAVNMSHRLLAKITKDVQGGALFKAITECVCGPGHGRRSRHAEAY